MDHQKAPEKIDLIAIGRRYFKWLGKLWYLALILALLLSGVNYVRARSSYTPYYECQAVFTVDSSYGAGDVFTNSQYYDAAAAKQMAASFPYMLSTDMMRDQVTARLDKAYINGTISASVVAETNLLQLTVRSNDPQDAYDILCAVIDSYPSVAVYMVDNPVVTIREEPTVPEQPINPFSGKSALMKGGIVGLLLGLAIIAVPALLSKTVDTPEQLKKVVNLPLLATVPHVYDRRKVKGAGLLHAASDPGMAEAIRGLRIKIRKTLASEGGKVVMLTSTVPGEGKSTICANLAISLASEGNRVMLLDGDLRKQSISGLFGEKPGKAGLMELLNPKVDLRAHIREIPGTSLSYISGLSTRKRHYSLDGKHLRRVLDALAAEYDYVVVDCPPCSVVSDAATICRYADAVVYVVRQEHAGENQLLDAIDSLHHRDIPLRGCILNDAPLRHRGYGYGYGYGYGEKKSSHRRSAKK